MNRIKKYSDIHNINESFTVSPVVEEYWNKLSEIQSEYKRKFTDRITTLLSAWINNKDSSDVFELDSPEYIHTDYGTITHFLYERNTEWWARGYRGNAMFEQPINDFDINELIEILNNLSGIKDLTRNLNMDVIKKLNI